jgi:DinB superfamily
MMRLLAGLSQNNYPSLKLFHPLTADSESGVSLFQLASLLEQVQCATQAAKKLVLGRSANDLTSTLEPGSWSATECLDHLARTTRSFLPAISKAVSAAPKLTTNRPFRIGTIALLLIRNLEPPYRLRYKVLPQLVPQEKNFEAAWSLFEESQSRLSQSVLSATGLAIDKVKVQCPVNAHVTYNAYGAFRMLAAHQRRHLWQMEQILKAIHERRAVKPAV